MDYKKLSDAIRLCGSTPNIDQCKSECPYYAGGDMTKCIPRMTQDAADAIDKLEREKEKAVGMIHKLSDKYGTCTGCKRLNKECSHVYICECDGEDHWEWEGL